MLNKYVSKFEMLYLNPMWKSNVNIVFECFRKFILNYCGITNNLSNPTILMI